jgi:hypothetical protein
MLAKIGFLILILGAVIGGNFVVFRSIKRRGIPLRTAFLPTPAGFKAVCGLNIEEWACLLFLVVPSFLLGHWVFLMLAKDTNIKRPWRPLESVAGRVVSTRPKIKR